MSTPLYKSELSHLQALSSPEQLTEIAGDAQPINSNQRTKWFAGLDSIRFILAFIVVLSHCYSPIAFKLRYSQLSYLRPIGMLLTVTFVGVAAVIAFFIISGFVIHYPNRNGLNNKTSFYLKRLTRVLGPLLVIALIGLPLNSPEKNVVWSLYCELIYYIIYPLLLIIPISWNNKLLASFALSVLLILTVGWHDVSSMLTNSDRGYHGEFWQFGPGLTWVIGLPCWLLGVKLAETIDAQTRTVSTGYIVLFRIVIACLAIMVQVLRFHLYVPYIISLTLFSLPVAKWLASEIIYYRSHPPLTILEKWGKFSYSLYLCHPIILAILAFTVPLNSYTYLFYIACCVACSYVFYLTLEKPTHLLAERLSARFSKSLPNQNIVATNRPEN